MAETIQPRLSAHQYLDGAEFELEIKQIVGDIFLCEDIGRSDKNSGSLLIVGKEGLMMVGTQVWHSLWVSFPSILGVF